MDVTFGGCLCSRPRRQRAIAASLRSVIADFHRKGPAATGAANITIPGDKAGG